VFGGSRFVAETDLPSLEVTAPCRVSNLITLAPSLVPALPSCPWPSGWTSGSSRTRSPEKPNSLSRILSWASAPLQRQPKHRAVAASPLVSQKASISDASLEVSSPSASSHSEQRHVLIELASLDRQRLQVFSTSWHFHPLRACRPYFMPDPLLGSPSRAFFLPHGRTPFPAPLPSGR
jgi:hypothetical protein